MSVLVRGGRVRCQAEAPARTPLGKIPTNPEGRPGGSGPFPVTSWVKMVDQCSWTYVPTPYPCCHEERSCLEDQSPARPGGVVSKLLILHPAELGVHCRRTAVLFPTGL